MRVYLLSNYITINLRTISKGLGSNQVKSLFQRDPSHLLGRAAFRGSCVVLLGRALRDSQNQVFVETPSESVNKLLKMYLKYM